MPAYVNGTSSTSGATTGTSFTVTYTPTAGNEVVIGASFSGTISGLTCKDNNNNALTLNLGGTTRVVQFYGVAVAGATSYVLQWTTARAVSAVLAEYSSPNGIGVTNQSSSGTSTTPTISVTSTGANSFIIAILGTNTNSVFTTPVVGNLRQQATGGAGNSNALSLVDNVSPSSGVSVTCSDTFTSGSVTYIGVAFELLALSSIAPALFTPPVISAEYTWGGGDGW